jgi:hypothetical protein
MAELVGDQDAGQEQRPQPAEPEREAADRHGGEREAGGEGTALGRRRGGPARLAESLELDEIAAQDVPDGEGLPQGLGFAAPGERRQGTPRMRLELQGLDHPAAEGIGAVVDLADPGGAEPGPLLGQGLAADGCQMGAVAAAGVDHVFADFRILPQGVDRDRFVVECGCLRVVEIDPVDVPDRLRRRGDDPLKAELALALARPGQGGGEEQPAEQAGRQQQRRDLVVHGAASRSACPEGPSSRQAATDRLSRCKIWYLS